MEWLNHLDFWLMVITLGAMAYFLVWKDRIQPLIRRRPPQNSPETAIPAKPRSRVRSLPLRSPRGRWAGSRSLPAQGNEGNDGATELQPGNEGFSASESEVTSSLPVTSLPNSLPDSLPSDVAITVAEAALIAVRLSSGMSPSNVAKSLPGYSPKKNYAEYTAKVRRVKQELEAAQQAEAAQVA